MAAAAAPSPSPATSLRGHLVLPPLTRCWPRRWVRKMDLRSVTPEARAESTREAKIAIAPRWQRRTGVRHHCGAICRLLRFKERENLLLKALCRRAGQMPAPIQTTFSAFSPIPADSRMQSRRPDRHGALCRLPNGSPGALPLMLGFAGRIDEARSYIAEMKRKWPDNPDVLFKSTEFTVESQQPPFTKCTRSSGRRRSSKLL